MANFEFIGILGNMLGTSSRITVSLITIHSNFPKTCQGPCQLQRSLEDSCSHIQIPVENVQYVLLIACILGEGDRYKEKKKELLSQEITQDFPSIFFLLCRDQ